ncbi:MAG: AAA family ATPase [Pseudomonadota bacterium]
MISTKIFSRACVLLLTSSLTSTIFAGSKTGSFGDGIDTDGTAGFIGTAPALATQADYNLLFEKSNHTVKTDLMSAVAKLLATDFVSFFMQHPNETKEDRAEKYVTWTIDTGIMGNKSRTPSWESPFFSFIIAKDHSLNSTEREARIALSKLAKTPQKSTAYIPPQKRANWVAPIELPTQQSAQKRQNPYAGLPQSNEISSYLKQNIVGQDDAMSSLDTTICSHFVSVQLNKSILENPALAEENGWVPVKTTNILMIGQTGSGKTETIKGIKRYVKSKSLDIEVILENTSGMTTTGYVGWSPSDIIKNALIAHNYDIEKTQNKTIIFIDEIDKLRAEKGSGLDITGTKVQNELLKYLGGGEVTVEIEIPATSTAAKQLKSYTVDTSNILFICAGAFDGLQPTLQYIPAAIPIQKKRLATDLTLAPTASIKAEGTAPTAKPKTKPLPPLQKIYSISPAALVDFGLKAEFLGRLQNFVFFKPLNRDGLRRILIEPKNSLIKQARTLLACEYYGINTDCTDEFYDAIITKALESNTGARSLESIVAAVINPIKTNANILRQELNGETLTLTKEMVEQYAPQFTPPADQHHHLFYFV